MHALQSAAQIARVHPRTLRRWIADGKVEATKGRGSNGAAWYFTAQQLDRLRTLTARDVEPVASPEPVAELEQATALAPASAAQPLDLAGLVAAVASTVADARADAATATAASYRAQLDAERQAHAATVAAMRAQLDAERRRADDAADATAHARALLEEARALLAAATRPAAATRATQPLDRGMLRSIAGGG